MGLRRPRDGALRQHQGRLRRAVCREERLHRGRHQRSHVGKHRQPHGDAGCHAVLYGLRRQDTHLQQVPGRQRADGRGGAVHGRRPARLPHAEARRRQHLPCRRGGGNQGYVRLCIALRRRQRMRARRDRTGATAPWAMVPRRRSGMVKRRIATIVLALWPLWATAQNYAVTDTVTEYHNKGTFYHDRFEGRKTANGEIFDQNKFTAAHWKIKLGTMVMVTNRNTGLQVIVRVNDRCPKRGVFDLSHRAATAIGIKGCQPVTVRILPDGYEERWAQQETMFDSVYSKLVNKAAPEPPSPKENIAQAPKKIDNKKTTVERYNLILSESVTHTQAFEHIELLPRPYRDNVIIEPTEDSGKVRMILDVRLPADNANDLGRALRHSFKDIAVTPCE